MLRAAVFTVAFVTAPALAAPTVEVLPEANGEVSTFSIVWDTASTVEWVLDETELFLQFSQPLDGVSLEVLRTRLSSFVAFTIAGYDSLLVVFKPDVDADVRTATNGVSVSFFSTMATEPNDLVPTESPPGTDLRVELIRAEVDRRNGNLISARRTLRALMEQEPGNYDVLMRLAGVETELGRPENAIFLYNRALSVRLGDENATEAKQGLLRQLRGGSPGQPDDIYIGFETTVQRVRDADRQVWGVATVGAPITDDLSFEAQFEQRRIKATDIRTQSGALASINEDSQRAEIGMDFQVDQSTSVGADLLAAPNVIGFGVSLEVQSRSEDLGAGTSTAELRVNEPYWGFVETFASDGHRSRIRAAHVQSITDETTAFGEVSLNQYGIDGTYNAADSVGLQLGVSHAPSGLLDGAVASYSMDGEYVYSQVVRTDGSGAPYRPVPVVLRETHRLQLAYDLELARSLNLLSYGGYIWDRYNLFGFFGGFSLKYDPNEALSMSLRGDQNITSSRGGDAVVQQLGFDLLWRY